MRFIWKLLQQHINMLQLVGFFFANLCGMLIVLFAIQFYNDVSPLFSAGDSFMKKDYIIVTKRVSTLGSFVGKNNAFTDLEINEIRQRPFTKSIGGFQPSQFTVTGGIGMQSAGIHFATEMFFESVPDEYVDVSLDEWHFDHYSEVIPIIIPRNYLNLYNFGFAQARNLPKLSEGIMGMIQFEVTLRGNGKSKQYKGNIVGFSNRLNTILVPEEFMTWANKEYAPQKQVEYSRLIVEVSNPADDSIAKYFREKGYETEDDKLDAGKTSYFLKLMIGIVLTVGLLISVLSFYILMLSIYLLLQKNTTKLENLLLIGYSPGKVAFPYQLLTVILNAFVLAIAFILIIWLRNYYVEPITLIFPSLKVGSLYITLFIGALIFIAVSVMNIFIIKKKIRSIWYVNKV